MWLKKPYDFLAVTKLRLTLIELKCKVIMKNTNSYFLTLLIFLYCFNGNAQSTNHSAKVANCPNTTAQIDLEINNVRARLLTGGDLWYDPIPQSPHYEVPKGSGKHSIYNGSFWIGGIDQSGTILSAAQTYRQGTNDFWAGPISRTSPNPTGDISTAKCNQYDRFWKINRSDVANFIQGGAATADMISWPGNGDIADNELPFLAPFFDSNNDGIYNHLDGDYPNFNMTNIYPPNPGTGNSLCSDYLLGDQMIWWVFNDVGNVKTETNSDPIGIEVRTQAFAYASTDSVLSYTTFYRYEIINRSNETYTQTYAGVRCDPDLGNYADDYIGCDVGLALGYSYNGDNNDDGIDGYGLNPPAVGIDFLQGPLMDTLDGIDNNKNGITDELYEDIRMSNFMFYNNINGVPTGNPSSSPVDYYNYLRNYWLNGLPTTYGLTGIPCNYMFPNNTDPAFSTPWTMSGSGLQPGDFRFIMSAGPFTMLPGEVNYITDAVIWQRTTSGGPTASLALLIQASASIQAFFDNCFVAVGMEEQLKQVDFKCYPNPFYDKITIETSINNNDITSIELYNLNGSTVPATYVFSGERIVLNTTTISNGTYLLSFKLKSGKFYSKKIVKL